MMNLLWTSLQSTISNIMEILSISTKQLLIPIILMMRKPMYAQFLLGEPQQKYLRMELSRTPISVKRKIIPLFLGFRGIIFQ